MYKWHQIETPIPQRHSKESPITSGYRGRVFRRRNSHCADFAADAQQAGVWPIALANEETQWLWAGDLWHSTPDGLKGHDRLYMGPIAFGADGMPLPLEYVEEFELDIKV